MYIANKLWQKKKMLCKKSFNQSNRKKEKEEKKKKHKWLEQETNIRKKYIFD